MGADGDVKCSPRSTVSFVSGVVMGTVNTLVMKAMYDHQSVGIDGKLATFEKPIFLTLVMFASMFFSLPIYYVSQFFTHDDHKDEKVTWRALALIAIPAAFDLVGTCVSQVGLLYVTASLFMLVRCFVIVVTAILKVTVLRDHLAIHMWIGVAINFISMVVVSAPSFLDGGAVAATGRDPRLGIMYIALSCVVQGAQYVFEEKIMSSTGGHNIPALVVVGMEGFWGLLFSIGICWPLFYAIPGPDKGSMENMTDAVVMIRNNPNLFLCVVVFFVSVALYNMLAVFITKLLSSVWHAILDNFRPVAVWTTDLAIYYWFTNGHFGEAWVYPGSWLQLAGMVMLFFGTAVYNGSVPQLIFDDLGDLEEQRPLSMGTGVQPMGSRLGTPRIGQSPYVASALHTPGVVRRVPAAAVSNEKNYNTNPRRLSH